MGWFYFLGGALIGAIAGFAFALLFLFILFTFGKEETDNNETLNQ